MVCITSVRVACRAIGRIHLLTDSLCTGVFFARLGGLRTIGHCLTLGWVQRIKTLQGKEARWILTFEPAIVPPRAAVAIGVPTATLIAFTHRRCLVLAVVKNISFATPFKSNETARVIEALRIYAGVSVVTRSACVATLIHAALLPLAGTSLACTFLAELSLATGATRVSTTVCPTTFTVAGSFTSLT